MQEAAPGGGEGADSGWGRARRHPAQQEACSSCARRHQSGCCSPAGHRSAASAPARYKSASPLHWTCQHEHAHIHVPKCTARLRNVLPESVAVLHCWRPEDFQARMAILGGMVIFRMAKSSDLLVIFAGPPASTPAALPSVPQPQVSVLSTILYLPAFLLRAQTLNARRTHIHSKHTEFEQRP